MDAITPTQSFFESFLNTSHVVLGKKLKPYCIYHLMLLTHIGSPLISGGVVTRKDLMLAAVICSESSPEAIFKALEARGIAFRLWQWKARRLHFETELEAFSRYLQDFASLPDFEQRIDASGSPVVTNEKIPSLLCHAAQLIKFTGWDEQKVFSMPLGKVIWFNLAFGYLETGETRVVSETELLAQKLLKALKEKANDKGGNR